MSSDKCKNWQSALLKKHQKSRSRLAHLSLPTGVDPIFETEFSEWKNLPKIGYQANVASLYDMNAISKGFQSDPCSPLFLSETSRNTVSGDLEKGVSYPFSFWLGLSFAASGILLTFLPRRKK
jgi:hypothetical protein